MGVGVLAFQGDFAEHLNVLCSLNVEAIEVRSLQDLAKVDGLIIPGGESTVIARFLNETGVGIEIVRRVGKGKKGTEGKVGKEGSSDSSDSPLDRELEVERLVSSESFTKAIKTAEKIRRPLAIYGTCAGAIILAKEATGKNAPKPLGLIDITIDRNAYGSQVDSFETEIRVDMRNVIVETPRRDVSTNNIRGVSTKQSNIPVAFIRAPKITRVGKDVEVLAKHKGLPVLVRQGNVLAGTFHPEVRGENRIHRLFLDMIVR